MTEVQAVRMRRVGAATRSPPATTRSSVAAMRNSAAALAPVTAEWSRSRPARSPAPAARYRPVLASAATKSALRRRGRCRLQSRWRDPHATDEAVAAWVLRAASAPPSRRAQASRRRRFDRPRQRPRGGRGRRSRRCAATPCPLRALPCTQAARRAARTSTGTFAPDPSPTSSG